MSHITAVLPLYMYVRVHIAPNLIRAKGACIHSLGELIYIVIDVDV